MAGASEEDVDEAVRVADETFRSGVWRDLPIHDRARLINRFADGIEARMTDLYRLETLNNGRPITETRAQITRLAEWYRYNAALLLADRGSVVPLRGDYHAYTSRFPLGVVGILSSFNHPMMIASKSLAPALATGNTVVLKPSEQTPLTALLLGQIAQDAGIPDGVLNVVPGLGPTAGAALTEHPLVKKAVFTGGTEPGRAIALATAKRFAKATLELGGKSPVLIFDDTPIDVAARGAAFGGFIGAGQTCIAGSRLLIQRGIYDDVVEALSKVARSIRIGDPALDDHPARPGHLEAGPGTHPRVRRARPRRRRAGRHRRARRRGARPPRRVLHRAHRPRRRHQRHAGRPRGDLRAGRRRHPLRRRGGGHHPGQRLAVRAGLVGLDAGRRPCAPGGRAARDGHGLDQRPPPARPVVAVGWPA